MQRHIGRVEHHEPQGPRCSCVGLTRPTEEKDVTETYGGEGRVSDDIQQLWLGAIRHFSIDRTPAISGSRKRLCKNDRLVRESAASHRSTGGRHQAEPFRLSSARSSDATPLIPFRHRGLAGPIRSTDGRRDTISRKGTGEAHRLRASYFSPDATARVSRCRSLDDGRACARPARKR
jgi:hypothetical protein